MTNLTGKKRTALEEVAVAVAGLEGPGLEELANEAPRLKELASKLTLDMFM